MIEINTITNNLTSNVRFAREQSYIQQGTNSKSFNPHRPVMLQTCFALIGQARGVQGRKARPARNKL
jgi:hypothetical protein